MFGPDGQKIHPARLAEATRQPSDPKKSGAEPEGPAPLHVAANVGGRVVRYRTTVSVRLAVPASVWRRST